MGLLSPALVSIGRRAQGLHAVSYTHLDVYKRQVPGFPILGVEAQPGFEGRDRARIEILLGE